MNMEDFYKMYPVKIECNDPSTDMPIFLITAIDETAAEIMISTPCNVHEWDRISPMIRRALVDMKFEGDSC